MSQYGNLPDLVEEVCYRIGQTMLYAWATDHITMLQKVRDEMMDKAESMQKIDAACAMQEHIDRSKKRPGNYVILILTIIRCWRELGMEDPVREMKRRLIDMLNVDPITKLALVGEYL